MTWPVVQWLELYGASGAKIAEAKAVQRITGQDLGLAKQIAELKEMRAEMGVHLATILVHHPLDHSRRG